MDRGIRRVAQGGGDRLNIDQIEQISGCDSQHPTAYEASQGAHPGIAVFSELHSVERYADDGFPAGEVGEKSIIGQARKEFGKAVEKEAD
jgi:hypothetical protein